MASITRLGSLTASKIFLRPLIYLDSYDLENLLFNSLKVFSASVIEPFIKRSKNLDDASLLTLVSLCSNKLFFSPRFILYNSVIFKNNGVKFKRIARALRDVRA